MSKQVLKRPPWRTVVPIGVLLAAGVLAYAIWSPGAHVTDGRHDLGSNGIWLQHGWLAHDDWFAENGRTDQMPRFRSDESVRSLALLLRAHHVTEVFPHLCPANPDGSVPEVDRDQAQRFLRETADLRVMPWVGGVRGRNARPGDPVWRERFAESIGELLNTYNFHGVHVNIEPCTTGSEDFLLLLEEVKDALPEGRTLSVAAYPPPTFWHPVPEVHWQEDYYRDVAQRADQLVVMMYDTSLRWQKPYRRLVASWTRDVLTWSEHAEVLLGLPAYADEGVGYHHPGVENLRNALLGVHGGLQSFTELPSNYRGVAIYCEWEMDESEWRYFRDHFVGLHSPGALGSDVREEVADESRSR